MPKSVEISASKIAELQEQLDKFPIVDLTNPQDGDFLQYDQSTGKWKNSQGIIDLGGPF